MTKFFKTVKVNEYDSLAFSNAINFVTNEKNELYGLKNGDRIITHEELLPENIDKLQLTVREYFSTNWEVIVPDYEKVRQYDEILDWLNEQGYYSQRNETLMDWLITYLESFPFEKQDELCYKIFTYLKRLDEVEKTK